MSKYASSDDVWKTLGEDSYTKVRDEVVGTGDGSTTVFDLDHDNVVSGSEDITYTTPTVNITGSGMSPDVTGLYYESGSYSGKPAYIRADGSYWLFVGSYTCYGINSTKTTPEIYVHQDTGTYDLEGEYQGFVGGTGSVYGDTSSTLLTTSIDYDDGEVTFSGAPLSGSSITADYNYADVPDSQVQTLLDQADDELEYMTGRSFDLQTSSEYIDVEDQQTVFWLRNYPVVTMDSLSTNTVISLTSPPSWSASTEGIGNEYLMDDNDKLVGTFEYIDDKPAKGKKRLYATYSHGYTTIPSIVQELNTLLAIRKLTNSALYRAVEKGRDNFTPVKLDEVEKKIDELTGMLRKQNINRI